MSLFFNINKRLHTIYIEVNKLEEDGSDEF